jgi:hypothetical protein
MSFNKEEVTLNLVEITGITGAHRLALITERVVRNGNLVVVKSPVFKLRMRVGVTVQGKY